MPGIHPEARQAIDDSCPQIELILEPFVSDFTVTWASARRKAGSQINAALLRPEQHLVEMFGIDREILLLHSPYASIEQRTFQIANQILNESPVQGRAETMTYILVSAAPDWREAVERQSVDARQEQIVIPFGESECRTPGTSHLARNRMRDYLFARDLFDVQLPVAAENFFFGRKSLLLEICDSIRRSENVGLFGLRKTGKTSTILKLQRMLHSESIAEMYCFDLQDSELYTLRWWELLDKIRASLPIQRGPHVSSEARASREFKKTLDALRERGGQRIVLALDEIEHITPGMAMRPHWERDFVEFWKTVRAIQNVYREISFIVVGVNSSVVEATSYAGHDNPLFSMLRVRYMPAFDREEIRGMLRRLSRPMGIKFNEEAYDYIHARYGGHPLLTRQACSWTHRRHSDGPRPIEITRLQLQDEESDRDGALFPFADHILSMLKKWYPSEYEMLEQLASGDTSFFDEMSTAVPQFAQHLRSYELVRGAPPILSIPMIATYLQNGGWQPAEVNSAAESLASIGMLRNRLEPKLRRFVRRQLMARLGAERWIDPILEVIPTRERDRLKGVDRDEILNSRLFLMNLLQVIVSNWGDFSVLESGSPADRITKAQFSVLLEYVNTHREDAHAKSVTEAELATLKVIVPLLEKQIAKFLDT